MGSSVYDTLRGRFISKAQKGAGPWVVGLLLFSAAKLALHLATSSGYGIFRDELYYLACTEHLGAGYVDHPAFSVLVLWVVRHVLGTSLLALRFVPALAGALTVAFVGLIAHRMGGGRLAQALAMAAALVAGEYLWLDHIYSMNAFDILFWCLAAYVVTRICADGSPSLWIALGLVLGLGLSNKIGVLWLGAGLAVGLVATAERRWLATRWPYIAGAITAALFLPYLVWEFRHGWPTLEFIRNATKEKMVAVSFLGFVNGQVKTMHPFTLPLWLGGLAWLLFHTSGKRFRVLAFMYVVPFAILVLNGSSRAGYLRPAYTWLFAAGGVAVEALFTRLRGRWTPWAYAVVLLVGGILTAPLALPILPVETYIRYAAALGVKPETEERKELSDVPQFVADMHGWTEIVETVAAVFEKLPPNERGKALAFAPDYGIAGAIDHFGPARGLPKAISGHNSWGPDGFDDGPLVVIGGKEEELTRLFGCVERAATIECGRCMPYENHRPVWVCRDRKLPVLEMWKVAKHYD